MGVFLCGVFGAWWLTFSIYWYGPSIDGELGTLTFRNRNDDEEPQRDTVIEIPLLGFHVLMGAARYCDR